MLPATFVLLGIIGWVALRPSAVAGRRSAVWTAVAWLGLCTLLATLSKANGALLPLLTGVIEWQLLASAVPVTNSRTRNHWRVALWVALALPSAFLATWLCKTAYNGFVHGLDDLRSWTLGERLLTQARVLVDYLLQLWLPRPFSVGLFNDGIVPSTGWLSPPTTLLCMGLLVVLLAATRRYRKRYPAAALAVFFYFAGHLLESTVVALELYFEHRNYLPAMLLFWPLALWLCDPSDSLRRVRQILAVVLPLLLAGMTWLGASLWGNTQVQGLVWAERNPRSGRAQAYAAQIEMARGQAKGAEARLKHALLQSPEDLQLALNLVGAQCQLGEVEPETLRAAKHALRHTRNTGRLGYEWFDRGFAIAASGTCEGFNGRALEQLLDAAQANRRSQANPGRRQDLIHLRGRIALSRNDPDNALAAFDAAFLADPRPSAGLQQAAMLGAHGYPRHGLRHLQRVERSWKLETHPHADMASVHQWLLWRQGYWQSELTRLRDALGAAAVKARDQSVPAESSRNAP